MKITIVTTPIRPEPSYFPPFGALTLVHHLKNNGFDDVEFYNIDANRPDYQTALDYIVKSKPDVLGISAVVSTAYEYSKRLSMDVKRLCPDTLIVLGGNMGASANVLLQKTGIDLVAIGEGEVIFLNVVKRAVKSRKPMEFSDIPGLALLDENKQMVNTGYQLPLPANELYQLNWDDLEESSDINMHLPLAHDPDARNDHIIVDKRFMEEHRLGKRIGTLYTSKGCVSRCTFCHRWDKGIRFIPVPIVMERLDELIERYNVGFLFTADENFGTNQKWLAEFCAEIKKRDVLWRVGTRAKGITPEIVEMMRDAGCSSIVFGNETGSAKMLEIMEKKVSIEDNYNAFKWTLEGGLGSKVQLVLGMPGETPETINETIDFCKYTNSILKSQNPNDLSINYAQALPGTPLYEYARHTGLIESGMDGEEKYLLNISDRDAHDEFTTLNFTDYPKLICETWRPLITVLVNKFYVDKFGLEQYHEVLVRDTDNFGEGRSESGYYANPKRLMETSGASNGRDGRGNLPPPLLSLVKDVKWGLALICYPIIAYRLRHFLILLVIVKDLKKSGIKSTGELILEYLKFRAKNILGAKRFSFGYKSLRKILDKDIGDLPGDGEAMANLRKGR
jgi:anaerobic magnesium-protoporphyrin IX monomethyl ester cyclase